MPKQFLKRYLPDSKIIKEHKYLKVFGTLLHNPNLWHLNRYSVATAISVGFFSMFMPIPFQMVLAAALAITFRANLPLAVITVWISNPFTMPPMFYFAYKLGATILGIPPQGFHIELSWHWFTERLHLIWQPLMIGSFICGSTSAAIGNILTRLTWRVCVSLSWRKRKEKRRKRQSQ